MLKITVVSVGKMKEKFFLQGVEEYSKRLSRYANVNIIELKDEPTPDAPTDKKREQILSKEGERIKEKIPKDAYIISLCVEGKQLSSEDFSDILRDVPQTNSNIVFIIGGSLGLSEEIKKLSHLRLSFSKMTFPHRLMRLILFEQIYRAFTIIEGKEYHK